MSIVLRNMAEIENVPKEHLLEICQMYSYTSKDGSTVLTNFQYKGGKLLLPPNTVKLQKVADILGTDIVDKRTKGKPLKEPFTLKDTFNLRDYQVVPAHEFVEYLKENQYGMLQGETGSGKTSVTTYVAGHFGCKVLVLCDMGSLQGQWEAAFNGVWGKKVQIVSSKDTEFADVCCATFQLLNKNATLLEKISEEFGLVITDETHISAAESWKKVLLSINSYYRCGISATIFRKNYERDLLVDLIGPIAVEMYDENKLIPKINFVQTGVNFCSSSPDDYTTILTDLAFNEQRNALIISIIKKGTELNRKILVIAPRVEQLKVLCEESKDFCKPFVYAGSTTLKQDLELKERLAAGEIDVIISANKCSKGVDLPSLDVLVIATPTNNETNVVQWVGRVLRKCEGKPKPIVFDLVDGGSLAAAFKYNRTKWYKKMGFEIGTGG